MPIELFENTITVCPPKIFRFNWPRIWSEHQCFLKLPSECAVHPGLKITSFRRRWVSKQGLPSVTHSRLKMHFSLNKHLLPI